MVPTNETEIQQGLWPVVLPTDPAIVAKMYDSNACTYRVGAMSDGWGATFDLMRREIDSCLAEGAKSVLDAGCGDGILAEQISFPPGVALHGIDLSSELIGIAQSGGKYASLQVANVLEELPFPPGTFDLVVCNGVLGYCASNTPFLEFLRLLAPGGHMLFTFRHAHFLERGYDRLLADFGSGCRVVRQSVFDPFPANDGYTHPYIFTHVQKNALAPLDQAVLAQAQAPRSARDTMAEPQTKKARVSESRSLASVLSNADVSLEVLEVLADNSFDSILMTDAAEGNITYANKAFTGLTGYEAAEVLGKSPKILQGEGTDKKVITRLAEALKIGGDFEGKAINFKKDGTPFIMYWRVLPVKVGGELKAWVAIQREGSHV